MPTPKPGQVEYELFKEFTGRHWHWDNKTQFDTEKKITEFDWENFLPENLLKNVDTSSDSFKKFVRLLNYTQKTQYELH